ncbi:MAG TPA: aspartate kinase [Ruminococcaceae bacterium]|nr:aspartate kinase [Oscillospiraceae bacterium]
MMNITVTENVSAVTFNNVPLYKTIMEDTLTAVAEAGINIDMISMTAPTSERFGFGFTLDDDDMPKLLGVVKKLKEKHDITPMINSSNRKIVIKTGEMEAQAGFAAKVFNLLNKIDAMILLITTGVDEISVLIRESDGEAAEAGLREMLK